MDIRGNYVLELKQVYDKLIEMCRHIEIAIEKCIQALVQRDHAIAAEVFEEDKMVDRLEHDIEQCCLKLLLMEHPVASDFREITTALKMITDLERIGDQARNIAEIAMQFGDEKYIKKLVHIPQMAALTIQMVKDGVLAYVNRDLELARSLEKADDKIDELFKIVMGDLTALIRKDPTTAEQAILFMIITKYLERIGDHAVNIGEWVEYAITGRHGKEI
jgi:phosphate transport system protein